MQDAVITFPMFGEGFQFEPMRYLQVGGLKLHWYGFIIAVGLILAVLYALKTRKTYGLTDDDIIDMLIFAIPISIICARLYYVVFNFDLYRDNPVDIFKLWKGGLAIYGAIIGAVLTVVVYCKIKKISLGAMLDVGSLGLLIGQSVGRWANFINREAYGAETELPWRMGLTNASETIYVHPTFFYESMWNIIGFLILHFVFRKRRKFDGQIFAMYVAWYGLGRFFIEGLRADSLYLFGTGLRVSQMVAIITFGIAILCLVYILTKRQPTPDKLYVNRIAADEAPAEETPAEIEEIEEEEEPLEDGYEYVYIDDGEEAPEEDAEQ
ncbi:MAG: prolipoprotein diacylglyceryl transferase [Oscillospiraceae bacterium]|nr:prolipoprotein diacylglyceryl transferase [Oscillospiraceae bacterium]